MNKIENAELGMSYHEKKVDVIITPSVYLATFLGTMGCKPLSITKGPERTLNGDKVTKFIYDNMDGVAKDIYAHWGKPMSDEFMASINWNKFNKTEKQAIIAIISAFCGNLRHFLNEVKKQEND